jgi:YbbR domain-containing protein
MTNNVTQQNQQKMNQVLFNKMFLNNILWFIASFVLAFVVWVLASTQADPVTEQRFRTRIPVSMELDSGLVVVDQQTNNVWVTVRAQSSVHENLTAEDIIVKADLRGYGSGTHTIELETELARRGVADTQPRQITVTLEEIQVQQVQVVVNIPSDQDVPPSFTRQQAVLSESQVVVRGVASRVQRVVAAQATLDLRERRDSFRTDARLVAVDADGEIVPDVTVEPTSVEVSIEIRQRDDVREVSVFPRIDSNSLADGYTLASISYQPQTVFLIGDRNELANITTPLETELIDLAGRTAPFEIVVPIVFPDGKEVPTLGEPNLTVLLEIRAQTTTRQFENIPLEIVGLGNGALQAETALTSVVVLITGSAPIVREIEAEDISVILDLNGLSAGTHEITPRVRVAHTEVDTSGITINPASVTVNIRDLSTPTLTDDANNR